MTPRMSLPIGTTTACEQLKSLTYSNMTIPNVLYVVNGQMIIDVEADNMSHNDN